jgi:threonine aldolase
MCWKERLFIEESVVGFDNALAKEAGFQFKQLAEDASQVGQLGRIGLCGDVRLAHTAG